MVRKYSKLLQYLAAGVLFLLLILYVLGNTTDHPRDHLILDQWPLLLSGIGYTLMVSAVTLVLSAVLGFVIYLMMKSRVPFIRGMAVVFREIIMGTPLLVMVFLAVYVLGEAVHISSKFVLGIAALTLYTAPYVANSYQSAAEVIDEDQYVVMELYHFTGFQKYFYVILPQMVKPLLPAFINHLSGIIKGSALLKVVSFPEIAYVITVIAAKNWASVEGYLVMWIAYLAVTIPLSLLAQLIGRRLSR